jgi:hypothetical protein
MPIIVLYNSTRVEKSLCIDSVTNLAIAHAPMKRIGYNYKPEWDYASVKSAFDKLAVPV